MSQVVLYTTTICPYCVAAKRLLESKGVDYEEILIDKQRGARAEMMERSQRRSVPQIFVGDRHVGGHDDLVALDRSGELDRMLATSRRQGDSRSAT